MANITPLNRDNNDTNTPSLLVKVGPDVAKKIAEYFDRFDLWCCLGASKTFLSKTLMSRTTDLDLLAHGGENRTGVGLARMVAHFVAGGFSIKSLIVDDHRQLETTLGLCPNLGRLFILDCRQVDLAKIRLFFNAYETLGLSSATGMDLAAVSPYLTKIQTLLLKGCYSEYNDIDAGLKQLASRCKNLSVFIFAKCPEVTDEGFGSFTCDLTYLDLNGCPQITDKTIEVFSQYSSGFTEVDVSNCKNLTDKAVADISLRGKDLQKLSLHGCTMITDESLKALSSHCQKLQELDLSKSDITNDGLIAFAPYCTKLRYLTLAYCPKITQEGVAAFCKLCPKVKVEYYPFLG